MSHIKQNNSSGFDVYQKIEELIGIDLRSLGLFRILIGGIILFDILIRATDLEAHYTDLGVVPRSLIIDHGEQPFFLSLHMLSGGLALQIILFLATLIAAIALLVGYKSRIACAVCWILMLSLHVRNPFVNNLGDWMLLDLLFWGMFLPLGAQFSIDRQRSTNKKNIPVRALSIATMAILLQICFVYVFSVQQKTSAIWHTEGTAIQYALNLDRITTPFGRLLLLLPESWLQAATFATLFLEKWVPLFLLIPVFTSRIRVIIVVIFIGFHAGLALSLELGFFPFICMAAWVLFMPTRFWERRGRRFEDLLSNLFSKFNLMGRAGKIDVIPGISETLIAVFALFLMLSSALLYGRMMGEDYYEAIYKHVEPAVNTMNFKQRWNMFSPHPPKKDGWFVVVGYLEGNQVVNLVEVDAPISWERPDKIAGAYKNQRWLKYHEWVMNKWDPHAIHYARYHERLYNSKSTGSHELSEVKVFFMQEFLLDDMLPSSIERKQKNLPEMVKNGHAF